MTTTDPTPLAAQIAREHKDLRYGCKCGVELDDTHAAHIATVTERAVREQIAAEIEREADLDMEVSGERVPGIAWPMSTPFSRRLRRIAIDIRRAAIDIARGATDA